VRRRLTKVVLVVLGVFALIQLSPYRVSNPRRDAEPAWDSAATRRLAVTACFDCHSNRSKPAWYDRIAPVSWWITNHVEEGRKALNFSETDSRTPNWADALETVRGGSMPPGYYTWFGLHSKAKLTTAQRKALAAGFRATALSATGSS
jgi:mono/diheme cytochrome c family protein